MGRTKAETLRKQKYREDQAKADRVRMLEDPYWSRLDELREKGISIMSVAFTPEQMQRQLAKRIQKSKAYHREKQKMKETSTSLEQVFQKTSEQSLQTDEAKKRKEKKKNNK